MHLGRRDLLIGFILALIVRPGVAQQPARWWDALPRKVYRTLPRIPIRSTWFEVYRVAPGTFAIYEPGHFEEALSYLILGDDHAILFDTCLGIGDIKAVVDELTPLPVLVVNSHSHVDHVGGDRLFKEIAVLDSPFARERLAKGAPDLSRLLPPGSTWKPFPPGFNRKTYRLDPIRPTRFLRDGEVIDLGGRTLDVLATPGHTPDSLCLLDRANRMLFTGDTFYPAPLYAHTADANFDDYHRSAQRLGKLTAQVDVVCPGHNEATVAGAALGRLARAFDDIRAGRAAATPGEAGVLRYDFEGFSVLTRPRR